MKSDDIKRALRRGMAHYPERPYSELAVIPEWNRLQTKYPDAFPRPRIYPQKVVDEYKKFLDTDEVSQDSYLHYLACAIVNEEREEAQDRENSERAKQVFKSVVEAIFPALKGGPPTPPKPKHPDRSSDPPLGPRKLWTDNRITIVYEILNIPRGETGLSYQLNIEHQFSKLLSYRGDDVPFYDYEKELGIKIIRIDRSTTPAPPRSPHDIEL